uniref:Ycf54 n=1 Tax=Haramonas pauciplastida TaxID=478668 RepID=UPI002114D970|nr:Ycf54 [Haramonas pauciplastida]YP_010444181.1 Ycf54 [Haramonas pauciplastida]UTE95031.1 Ycf54 [Haramonas pauciplastida]UTE95067.1 Ycf54 [Haramonas pauciplastida]
MTNYYFILGSPKFLLDAEPTEEVLRERTQSYFKNSNKFLDFWILKNPKFIKFLRLEKVFKNALENNSIAFVSTNKNFILWLKLRLNNVLIGKIQVSEVNNGKDSPFYT